MKNDFDAISGHYRINRNAIYLAGASEWGIDPYAWDHEAGIVMSPIETALWCDIRLVNAVMYPQYPVAGYFVDFGNPCAKVAFECDGAAWHTDKAKDAARQKVIEQQGWVVYRFTGRECFEQDHDPGDGVFRLNKTLNAVRAAAMAHGIRGAWIGSDKEHA